MRTQNFDLDLGFNIGTNSNKIESLGSNPDGTSIDVISIDAYNQHRVGYPVGSWFRKRVVSAEFDPTTGEGLGGDTFSWTAAAYMVLGRRA